VVCAVTAAVCEVGPATVRMVGSPSAPTDSTAVAAVLDAGADMLVVVDDTVVPAVQVWRGTLAPLLRDRTSVRVVHPTWWTPQRVALLVEAVEELADSVETATRTQALARDDAVVVEIAAHLVVVGNAGEVRAAVPRPLLGRGDVADRVVRTVLETRYPAVLLDAPPGVPGADVLAADITRRLQGIRTVTPARIHTPQAPPRDTRQPRTAPRLAPLLVAALVVAVALTAVVAARRPSPPPLVRALLEGRVTTQIPDGWEIRRVRNGPGSARVEVVAPDGAVALHVTQAPVPGRSLTDVAADLRTALDRQPPGVFTDFHPHDEYAGRPVVSYNERRGDRDIRWLVLVDGDTRIGIGCQSPVGAPHEVEQACGSAVRTAHEIT
jgi:type VII secretion-associated protein (TIGR03931 family)